MVKIREYQTQDSKKLAKIFKTAILAIDDSFYNHSQKKVWIGNRSLVFWQNRFMQSLPKVAVHDGEIVGFAEFLVIANQGEIDCFYIDPNYQNLGVGKALLSHIVTLAKDNNLGLIAVNASHNAKPFFEKHGFKTIQKNSVKRENILLENWQMVFVLEKL